MARGASALRRMELNRAKVDQVVVAIGLGLGEFGREVVMEAAVHAPDSPYAPYPTAEGLPKQGGVLVYFDGKKIVGIGGRGSQPRPPRRARVSRGRGLIAIIGWGFPARFAEFGTARQAAYPFFTPAVEKITPQRNEIIERTVRKTLGSKP